MENKQQLLNMIGELFNRVLEIKEINNYDELRLIVIQERIKDINKMLDEFGQPLFKRIQK